MKTVTKKEIRLSVQNALTGIMGSLEIEKPSRKTSKLIEKTSKKISRELETQLKKQLRKMEKAGKAIKTDKKKSIEAA